jgi:quercetin dioxygenase-like cupin family protein
MKIIHYQSIDPKPVTTEGAKDVTIRWLIAKTDGAPNFAMRLFEIQPGGQTPLHSHEQEHEVFILEGEAAVWKEGEEALVRPGTAVFIPSEERHCFFNKGKSVMRFLCLVPVE